MSAETQPYEPGQTQASPEAQPSSDPWEPGVDTVSRLVERREPSVLGLVPYVRFDHASGTAIKGWSTPENVQHMVDQGVRASADTERIPKVIEGSTLWAPHQPMPGKHADVGGAIVIKPLEGMPMRSLGESRPGMRSSLGRAGVFAMLAPGTGKRRA